METFNIFCISFLFIEFYVSNTSLPTYLFFTILDHTYSFSKIIYRYCNCIINDGNTVSCDKQL